MAIETINAVGGFTSITREGGLSGAVKRAQGVDLWSWEVTGPEGEHLAGGARRNRYAAESDCLKEMDLLAEQLGR